MRTRSLIWFVVVVLGVLLFGGASVYAQGDATGAKPADKKEDYQALLTRLKSGLLIDFGALRQAYTETEGFSGYGDSGNRPMTAALNAKKYKDALALAEKRLAEVYVDLNAHYVAYVANHELGNTAKEDFHREVFVGLMNSIIEGHDGLSTKTAYSVISIDEEHMVVAYLGLVGTGKQALVKDEGHAFDQLTVMDPKTKKQTELFFNIDRFFGKF